MTKEELNARCEALTSIEEAFALAKECGYTGTMDELMSLSTQGNGREKLDDADLEGVSGGFDLKIALYIHQHQLFANRTPDDTRVQSRNNPRDPMGMRKDFRG